MAYVLDTDHRLCDACGAKIPPNFQYRHMNWHDGIVTDENRIAALENEVSHLKVTLLQILKDFNAVTKLLDAEGLSLADLVGHVEISPSF